MITWSPTKHVIRIIGPECFRTINREEHEAAAKRYRDRRRHAQDTAYLLTRLGDAPEAVRLIERAVETAKAVDEFRARVSKRFDLALPISIWNQVRDGVLTVCSVRREIYRAPDGSERERVVEDFERYGELPGHVMLQPNARPIHPLLERALSKLRTIDCGENVAIAVQNMTPAETQRTARVLRISIDTAQEAFDQIGEVRKFMSAVSLRTLNAWGRHDRAPVRLHVRIEGGNFYFGQRPENVQRLTIPSAFNNELGTLPRLANTKLDAE
jgi:hypothetical protein